MSSWSRTQKNYLDHIFVDEEKNICRYIFSNGEEQEKTLTEHELGCIEECMWVPYDDSPYLYDALDIIAL